MNFHTGQWGTWGKGGDPGGGSGAWDVEFGIAFEVGPRHRVVPNASDTYMSESPGSSGLERSAQSCFIYCLIFHSRDMSLMSFIMLLYVIIHLLIIWVELFLIWGCE